MATLLDITDKWNKSLENTLHSEKAAKNSGSLWNECAKSYDSGMGKDYIRLNAYLRALDSRRIISKEDHVSDIGCGTGEFPIMLSPYVKWIDAIDNSMEMIKVMKNKIHNNINNISILKKDFYEIINNKYDLVIASFNPITYAPSAFKNYLSMSNRGLFAVSSAPSTNDKRDKLRELLFGKVRKENHGMSVEYPYEYLKVLGYSPDLSITKSSYTHMQPSNYAIIHYTNMFSKFDDCPKNAKDIISKFIYENSKDDMFSEFVEFSTGIITWIK